MNIKTNPTYLAYMSARRKNIAGKAEFILRSEAELVSYCTEMVQAITAELQQQRHCWLIDLAFSNGYIFSVDWAVISALSHTPHSSGQLRLELPAALQLLPITDIMEETMLSLYQGTSAPPNRHTPEPRNAAPEADETNRQLQQIRQTQAALEARVSQLRSEAERLERERQEAQARIQNQLDQANTQAETILQEAREKADSIRADLMQGIAMDTPQALPATGDDEPLRNAVSNETRRLETTIRTSLDAYRDEIHKMLYEFRTGLYKFDYTSLCFAYQKLYLFASNIFDKRIDALCGDLPYAEEKAIAQSSLRKVQGQLLKRVTSLEESLEKLGLIVFRPQAGEEYNAVYHTAENAEDDGYLEGTVRCCVCPGIRTNEQVLCQASVIVNTAENN